MIHGQKITKFREVSESGTIADPTETIFCLTPSTLFMSFGIVFGVLIVIILCAVCICIRFRNKQQKVIRCHQLLPNSFKLTLS